MTDYGKAALFMLISALSFAFMSVFVKLAGPLPVWEKVFFRNLISLVISGWSIYATHQSFLGQNENRRFLLGRAITGLVGMILYFYALDKMLLADVNMLVSFSPFFVTLLAWAFLNEKLNKVQVPALFVVFASALLIIKPRFDWSVIPALMAFVASITTGVSHTIVRKLGKKENPDTIIFYFSLLSTIVIFPIMMAHFVKPTNLQWLYLFLTGIFAAIGQYGLTFAYRYGKASEVTIFNFSGIVFSVLLGFFIWGELSDAYSIAGGTVILLMSVYIFYYNNKNHTS